MTSPRHPAAATPGPWLALSAVLIVAGVVLFWDLDERYLWQDEAAVALLGERLLTYGKPLGYDGRNLITMDIYRREEFETGQVPTASADAALRFFAGRGDFREDTTWIRHPWGSFLLAGLSIKALGRGTLQARLPFAASAVLCAALLWWIIRKRFDDALMAWLALLLCVGNVFWLLHMRQCHYNAPSCLMLLVTLAAYLRWQDGGRFGATGFVVAASVWFHIDYGSLWPVLALLFTHALYAGWPDIRRPVTAGLLFAAVTVPFVFYYDLLGRSAFVVKRDPLHHFSGIAFYWNQFLFPFLLLLPLGWLLWVRRSRLAPGQLRTLGFCLAIPVATALWLPWVVPMAFYRYLVHLTPLLALLLAWMVVELCRMMAARWSIPAWVSATVVGATLIVVPLPATLGSWLFPFHFRKTVETGIWLRPEWPRYIEEMSGKLPDPNRAVIQKIASRLEEGDEILVNYEDKPFMFYTKARVRGGIPGFRVRDPTPPRFFVFRQSANFTHRELFLTEARKYVWTPIAVDAADIPWSNVPDPWLRRFLRSEANRPGVAVFERALDPPAEPRRNSR